MNSKVHIEKVERIDTFHTLPHYIQALYTAPEKPDLTDLPWDKEAHRALSMSRDL